MQSIVSILRRLNASLHDYPCIFAVIMMAYGLFAFKSRIVGHMSIA